MTGQDLCGRRSSQPTGQLSSTAAVRAPVDTVTVVRPRSLASAARCNLNVTTAVRYVLTFHLRHFSNLLLPGLLNDRSQI